MKQCYHNEISKECAVLPGCLYIGLRNHYGCWNSFLCHSEQDALFALLWCFKKNEMLYKNLLKMIAKTIKHYLGLESTSLHLALQNVHHLSWHGRLWQAIVVHCHSLSQFTVKINLKIEIHVNETVWKNPYHCYLSNMAAAFCPEKQCVSLNPFPLASLEHIPRGLALSKD